MIMATNLALSPEDVVVIDGARANGRTAAELPATRGGFWSRVLARLVEARQRQAQAEVARYVAMNGGVLTDDLEREISRRYGGIVGR
jgi:hypothetical protein